jgi:hypothetical protein
MSLLAPRFPAGDLGFSLLLTAIVVASSWRTRRRSLVGRLLPCAGCKLLFNFLGYFLRRLQFAARRRNLMMNAETDFAYRVDRWDTYGGNIIHHIANMNDLELAMAAYEAACKQWPGEIITLRQGALLIKATRV